MSDSYIKHGFLAAVYEPWVQFEGSEWGDAMRALWEAYNVGIGFMWTEEQCDPLEKMLRSFLDDAGNTFFFGNEYEDSMYEREVLEAQLAYTNTAAYWKDRAESFKSSGGPETFISVEASLPDWMKPPPDADVNQIKRSRLIDQRADLEQRLHKLNNEIAELA